MSKDSKKNTSTKALPSVVQLIGNEIAQPMKTTNGHNISKSEAVMRSAFAKAVKGDVASVKFVMKLAEQYCPIHDGPSPTSLLQDNCFGSYPFTQEDYDGLKKAGFLPADSPALLKDIDEHKLNIAFAKSKAYKAKLKALP